MFSFKKGQKDIVYAPVAGHAIRMSEVKDETFSQEMLGKGIAIEPTDGIVVAPFHGKVQSLFETKHAIGLLGDNGIEVLIHIGIDTVELGGSHYTAHVAEGDKVKKGQVLIEFDREAIKKAGYMMTTPVIVTNTEEYKDVEVLQTGEIALLDEVVRVVR